MAFRDGKSTSLNIIIVVTGITECITVVHVSVPAIVVVVVVVQGSLPTVILIVIVVVIRVLVFVGKSTSCSGVDRPAYKAERAFTRAKRGFAKCGGWEIALATLAADDSVYGILFCEKRQGKETMERVLIIYIGSSLCVK